MGTIRGGITITTVEDGSTYNGYLSCITNEPFQYYKEGVAVSSWTVSAKQPVFMPIIIAGGNEVQGTLTNVNWYLDSMSSTALASGSDYEMTAASGSTGPKLKIKADILSTIKASRTLYMQATANIDGVATVVSASIAIEYKEASGDVSDLVLTASDNGVCKNASGQEPAVEGIVLTAAVKKGGVDTSGYTFSWYAFNANDSDANNADDWQDLLHANAATNGYPGIVAGVASASGSMPALVAGQLWVPKAAIASSERIKCVGTKANSPTVTNYITLYDLSDPYIIEFSTTDGKTNINSKNPSLAVTATLKQLSAVVTPSGSYTWTVQGSDGSAITNTASGTNNSVMTLAYANTKGKGTINIIAETTK